MRIEKESKSSDIFGYLLSKPATSFVDIESKYAKLGIPKNASLIHEFEKPKTLKIFEIHHKNENLPLNSTITEVVPPLLKNPIPIIPKKIDLIKLTQALEIQLNELYMTIIPQLLLGQNTPYGIFKKKLLKRFTEYMNKLMKLKKELEKFFFKSDKFEPILILKNK